MATFKVEPGGRRTKRDGSRRFTPVNYSFDTRANVLATVIEDDWELEIQEQWRGNVKAIREHLIHQFGAENPIRRFGTSWILVLSRGR